MHPGSLTLAHSLVSYTDRCQSEEFLSYGSGYLPEEDHVDGRPKFKNVSLVTYVTNLQRGERGYTATPSVWSWGAPLRLRPSPWLPLLDTRHELCLPRVNVGCCCTLCRAFACAVRVPGTRHLPSPPPGLLLFILQLSVPLA